MVRVRSIGKTTPRNDWLRTESARPRKFCHHRGSLPCRWPEVHQTNFKGSSRLSSCCVLRATYVVRLSTHVFMCECACSCLLSYQESWCVSLSVFREMLGRKYENLHELHVARIRLDRKDKRQRTTDPSMMGCTKSRPAANAST